MSKEIIKKFNEIMDSFLIQTSPIVGTTYHFRFNKVIKINSLLPINQFITYALPLKDKILNKDETYFSNNDNHKDIFNNISNKKTLNKIFQLQDIYFQLDSESKSNLWDILQALVILSEDYLIFKNN